MADRAPARGFANAYAAAEVVTISAGETYEQAMLKIIISSGVLAIARLADAQQAIFLVRHAEDVSQRTWSTVR
jgi:hypothetical protein